MFPYLERAFAQNARHRGRGCTTLPGGDVLARVRLRRGAVGGALCRPCPSRCGYTDEEQRESARQAIRGLIDRIVIPPGDGLLQVVGNLGEMLTAAGGRAASAAVGYVGCGGGI